MFSFYCEKLGEAKKTLTIAFVEKLQNWARGGTGIHAGFLWRQYVKPASPSLHRVSWALWLLVDIAAWWKVSLVWMTFISVIVRSISKGFVPC
jgi:hypothetical protein